MTRLLAPLLALGALAPLASAHSFAPGVLTLEERADGHFSARWTPPREEPEAAAPWPAPCAVEGGSGALLALDCGAARLVGARLAAPGRGEVVLAITWNDARRLTTVLAPGAPALVVPPATAHVARGVAARYTRLGVGHILGGVDHLLFVLGLLLLVGRRRLLVLVLSAFTVGHSLTLALAALGALALPQAPVEALIAASLVLLAFELTRAPVGDSLARRRPALLAFGFGLLHGLGFAGALADLGLPSGDVPLALAAFNLGVELGQLGLVGALLALGAVLARLRAPAWRRAPAYALGSFGVALALARVAALAQMAP